VTPPVTDGTEDAVILAGRNKFIVDSHVAARALEADPVILSTRDTTVFVYNGENNHMDITYSEKQDFRSHKLAKDLPSEVAVDMAYKRMNLR